MTFKPAIWYPIAILLSVGNLVAVGSAATSAEPLHAAIHAALALGFGLWAQRLRPGPGGNQPQAPLEAPEALEALEAEVSKLRQELSETQERVDFVERMLAQAQEARRVGPQREGPKQGS
jgi:hypothetical protein